MLDPRALSPNPWNTNIVTPENERKLEESIKRLGFFRPVIVREIANSGISDITYQLLGGEHRAQAAVRLKISKIPVVNLGPISDLEAKEIGIADNARYGVDDQIAFAELVKDMGNADQLETFLPYAESDFADLFASAEIDLDALALDEDFERKEDKAEDDESAQPKAPKTHTIIRFKVTNRDAEDLTRLIEATKQGQGFTLSDELTNAGDALVHLLLNNKPAAAGEDDDLPELEDLAIDGDDA
jgi:ParB-like chromosome segregation protein Spo0J